MTLIEKLVHGIEISDFEINLELYYICDREHSSCNSDCPVFKLNFNKAPGSNKPFKENRGCDCFKDGREMYIFIKNAYKKAGEE